MGEHVIKLPDVGEGVAEAELVEWLVDEGENVLEDQVLASVMTDKATVEIPSPVEGKVIWRGADIGEIVAVGSPIIRLEVEGEGNVKPGEAPPAEMAEAAAKPSGEKPSAGVDDDEDQSTDDRLTTPKPVVAKAPFPPKKAVKAGAPRKEGEKPIASPAIRKRAAEAGVDLRRVPGSGPAGRITHEDLDAYFEGGVGRAAGGPVRRQRNETEEIKVVGLRRKIAEKMATAKSRIPHITYVDEVDVTALEELRSRLNADRRPDQPKLTILPFIMRALVRAIDDHPQMNARFDDDEGVVHRYGGVHIGVAAQTDTGLVVPVVRHAEARGLWEGAAELARLADAAKAGTCSREELSGSTITITSLGALGGIVTTPVINYPEVAIVGVNKMQTLPRWDGAQFIPRKVMNLSSSFDHRIIDGWDAAVFVQRIKSLLEAPAQIFIED